MSFLGNLSSVIIIFILLLQKNDVHSNSSVMVVVAALSQQQQQSSVVRKTKKNNQPTLQILGLGYVGSAVASVALEHSYRVCGTVLQLEENGDDPNQGSGKDEDEDGGGGGVEKVLFSSESLQSRFPSCSAVLVTIPPPPPPSKDEESDDDELYILYDNMVRSLPDKSWIGVISTTGVYGHHDGAWVDEESALLGQGEGATRYKTYEEEWQSRILQQQKTTSGKGRTLNIFRCAGIYGPDRSALHTLYKRGIPTTATSSSPTPPLQQSTTSSSPKGGVTNRIHVHDIAQAIVSAMSKSLHGDGDDDDADHEQQPVVRIYNLADDLPESRQIVMQYAGDLFASHNVTLETKKETSSSSFSPVSGRASRRSTELKLVSNKRMKEELLSDLMYPTYVEGLKSILLLPNAPWNNKHD